MDLSLLDYFATSKDSFLHRLPPLVKLLSALALIAAVILSKKIVFLAALLPLLYLLVLLSRLPVIPILSISLYPLLFGLVFAYANLKAGWEFFFLIVLRVVCSSTSMVLLFSTTPFPSIYKYLSRIMPDFLSTLIFLTFRAIFILSSIFEDIKKGFYLRKGFQFRRPLRSLQNLAKAFGYLISRGFDTNQKFHEALMVRGFKGKLYHYNGRTGL